MGIPTVAVSSGSACTSASLEPSYVLRALGVGDDLAHSSIRFSIGRFTTEAEVDAAADTIIGTVKRLRDMSPLGEISRPRDEVWRGELTPNEVDRIHAIAGSQMNDLGYRWD